MSIHCRAGLKSSGKISAQWSTLKNPGIVPDVVRWTVRGQESIVVRTQGHVQESIGWTGGQAGGGGTLPRRD